MLLFISVPNCLVAIAKIQRFMFAWCINPWLNWERNEEAQRTSHVPQYTVWGLKQSSYLIDVGVPHLGEESERGWGVGVIDWELNASLQNKTKNKCQDNQDKLCPMHICLLSIMAKLVMISAANKAVFTLVSIVWSSNPLTRWSLFTLYSHLSAMDASQEMWKMQAALWSQFI